MNSELSMDQVLIEKLTNILEVNLDKEHFGVKEFANEAGLSRSKLHRKLKSITGKSASRFIREFRLQKAMVMLQNNVATASEIAYRVGFSSPTYFNTCFHDFYGYPPGEVKFRNANGITLNEEALNLEHKNAVQYISKSNSLKKRFLAQRMVWINTLFILILSVISYNLYNIYKDHFSEELVNTYDNDKSIAILPFKNLSEAKEDKFFTRGVRTALQNQLSTLNGLKVISENSMEKYIGSTMDPSEIAKEIGVTYLMDGSVQKYGDSIRAIIYFINARENRQLKSMVFIEEFKNLLNLQGKIAEEVAEELNINLSREAVGQFEKKPTDNLQAYNLYLQGRFFLNQRTEEDLNKSLYYFNKSLELDSSYALAYVGLADTYLSMAWWEWHPLDEGFIKAKEFVKKALVIDNTISDAHSTLGCILTHYDRQWKEAEKEIKLALLLNPNNDTAHLYYYELLKTLGRLTEARAHIDKALELNPHSVVINLLKAASYTFNENYEASVKAYSKTLELAHDNNLIETIKLNMITCYLHLGKDDEAIALIKKLFQLNNSNEYAILLDTTYLKSGNEGIVNVLVDWMLANNQKKSVNSIAIAKLYSTIEDSENVLKYLEEGFNNNYLELPFLIHNSDFYFIKTNPRYVALLEKLDLVIY